MAKEYIERELAISETRKPRLTDAELRRRLACLPAADVVPVRNGRWIELENGDCKCSLCGCYHHAWEAYGYYCQHCGARMDGDGA